MENPATETKTGIIDRIRRIRRVLDPAAQQAIVVMLLASVALVFTLGITIDGIVIFTRVHNLREVTDRAAIAAALQLDDRQSLIVTGQTVEEFVRVEGIDTARIRVETCDSIPLADWSLAQNEALACGAFGQARVRVTIDQTMPALFLRLVMPDTLTISVSSVAEISTAELR